MSAVERGAQALGLPRADASPVPEEGVTPATSTAAAGLVAPARRRRRSLSRGRRLISPLVVLGIWQLTNAFKLISTEKLPPPSMVLSTASNLIFHPTPAFGSLQGAMAVSVQRFALGFAFGAGAALLLALVAGLSRAGEATIDPLVQMIRTLPLFGLIPVFIVWFGIGSLPKILLVALGASVPLYLNTYSGIRSIDGRLFELSQVLKLNRRERLINVVIPGALPQALVGLRQSLGAAWLSLVVAEQINANAGLGFMINQAATFLRNDVIFVALTVYTLLGLLTDWIVRLLERRALAWRTDLAAS
jgi:sulfonate transport system permease protein